MSKLLLPIILIAVLALAAYFLVIKQNPTSYPTTNSNPTYSNKSDVNTPSDDPNIELQRLDKLMDQANPEDFNDPSLDSGNI